jgi:hypothetical protein
MNTRKKPAFAAFRPSELMVLPIGYQSSLHDVQFQTCLFH